MVIEVPLACTVRDCGLLLQRSSETLACARGHRYDLARSGYFNLLQPQDRRSATPGDSPESVAARARLLEAGIGLTLFRSVVDRSAGELTASSVVADLGCGSGEALDLLTQLVSLSAVGIDLSVPATEHASRRFPQVTWVVANADRRLPLLDGTVDLIWSLHGRRQPVECARVLRRDGQLLIAVPGAEDLAELRDAVQGRVVHRDRLAQVRVEHGPHFREVDHWQVCERHALSLLQLRDLLATTYRGARRSLAPRIETLDSLEVTFASEVVLFQRR